MSLPKNHRGLIRTAGVLAAVAAFALLPHAAAVADDPVPTDPTPTETAADPPTDNPADYVPRATIDVNVHQPVCDGDVPYLEYRVDVTGTPNTTVTITWVNPDGDDIVQSDLPLNGRVLWPGAEVDAQGKPTDWPGWRLENGEWVVGDEYDWVRQPTQVLFKVNPEETITVAYPPSTPNCATNPPDTPEPEMKVRTLTPICIEGVSYLDYAIDVTGTPNHTATLTWRNPTGGPDVVQSGMPLAGRVLWLGAYPERSVDLPADEGWELVNNTWINTGQYPWAVGTLNMTFAVNPERTVAITYPSQTEHCFKGTEAPPAPTAAPLAGPGDERTLPASQSQTPRGALATTGAQVAMAAGAAAALLVVGTVIVVLTRRRRGHATIEASETGGAPHDTE